MVCGGIGDLVHVELPWWKASYLGHSSLAAESTTDAIVDTLGLSPAGVNAFETVALVAIEALAVYGEASC